MWKHSEYYTYRYICENWGPLWTVFACRRRCTTATPWSPASCSATRRWVPRTPGSPGHTRSASLLEACRFLLQNQLMLFYNHIALDWLWSLLLLFVYRIACGRGHMRCPYISPINVLLWKSYWTCHCIVLVHKIYTQVPFSTHRTDNFKRTLIIWQLNVITAGNRGRCTTSNLNMNINPPVSDVNISTSAEQWTTSCTAQTCINRNLLQIYVSLF